MGSQAVALCAGGCVACVNSSRWDVRCMKAGGNYTILYLTWKFLTYSWLALHA